VSLYAGVDLGGTKTAVAILDEEGTVRGETVFPTRPEEGPQVWADRAAEAVRALAPQGVVAVGVGAAGQVQEDGTLVATANVGGWRDFNPGAWVGERLGVRGQTDNDAKTQLRAELYLGSARGAVCPLLVTVGTGIGSAFARGGEIYRGSHNFAGELGHTPVLGQTRRCGCGARGHLETVASGRGIERTARERAAGDPGGILARHLHQGEGAQGVFAAAEAGDRVARDVLAFAAQVLGEAIAGAVTLLDVDRVILAGGLAHVQGEFWPRARAAFEAKVHPTLRQVPWRRATLGERAGAVGACLLARSLVS
jgi:glucokinase